MSTRPLPPPDIIRDDPGPWSVISSVFSQAGRPGKRRPLPPTGLMLSPPPDIGLDLAGIDPESRVAGLGPIAALAAAREPALRLTFHDDGTLLRGVSPGVVRAWSIPDLAKVEEERPPDDPAAGLLPQVHPASLGEAELPGSFTDPTGQVIAVFTREGRFDVLALLGASDRSVVRWVRGVRSAAWSPDGERLALGGTWGVLLVRARETPTG